MFESKIGKGRTVFSIEEAKKLAPTGIFVVDLETAGEGKLPGDSPCYAGHGIAGIAMANALGDSIYIVVNDSRDLGGVPIKDAIDFLNQFWMPQAKVLVGHHFKFDLGFLLRRGLVIKPETTITDTYIITSIRTEGIFSSNKLKEIVKEKYKIETESKDEVKDFLEANNTNDYADVPAELLGRYACDDCVFTLMLLFAQTALSDEEQRNHDLHIRNALHLINAEFTGICVNVPLLPERLAMARTIRDTARDEVKKNLGGTELNVDDEQVMLGYLHSKNLHSPPRDKYGEKQFVFDGEFLRANGEIPLTQQYVRFHQADTFIKCLSGSQGEMGTRIFSDKIEAGFHISMHQSLYSRGGIVLCKQPDFTDRLELNDEIRALFKPRNGKKFVVLQAKFLQMALIAFYCQDKELLDFIVQGGNPVDLMASRTGLPAISCMALMRQLTEGSGNALLHMRLKNYGVRFAPNGHFKMRDKFAEHVHGFNQFISNIGASLKAEGIMRDRLGRRLKVLDDKLWRAHAILVGSSNGSILSLYLDLFCRVAEKTDAKLLLVCENEFVFETEKDDFVQACQAIAQRDIIDPKPRWKISVTDKWSS